MQSVRKITVELPEELLRKAQRYTGKGITPTIRQGLELVAAAHVYGRLRKLQGKVNLSINLKSLREDRDCR